MISARRLISICCLALLLSANIALAAPAQPGANTFWQTQSIYQVITDRFYNGDPSNDNAHRNFDPAGHGGRSVHGGDFKGLEEKLDYIKSLGATAIWISPVVLNDRGEFHGYAGLDFYKVDPHWGTLADLQHLIKAAHSRGLLVIDDIVVNHGGNLLGSSDPGYPEFKYPPDGYQLRFRHADHTYPPPFDLNPTNPAITNLFHNHGEIQDYNDPIQLELGSLSGLDDFRTETPYVREQMKKIYEFWIEQVGFDAFRIDTVKHVEMGFWREWCPVIRDFAHAHGQPNFFMFGEAPVPNDAKVGSYTGRMGDGPDSHFKLDSILDYTLYYKINSLFAVPRLGTDVLAKHYAAIAANYDPAAQNQLVTFLDNHDQPRFMSVRGATVTRLKVALVFLYTSQGIPCLYYGTEQAFDGGKDPWDREDMFAGQFEWGPSMGDNFNMTHPIYQLVAKLNNFRRLYPEIATGKQTILYSTPKTPGLFAYTRRIGDQEAIIVFNTAPMAQTLPANSTIYPAGTKLQNLLDDRETLTIQAGDYVPHIVPTITVPAESAKIFLPANRIRPLDPVITAITPPHDAKQIPPTASIVVQFSQPMNTNSVQQAFSTVPSVPGSFSWNVLGDALTFTPAASGYPGNTLVAVHLADTAYNAASGLCFHAAFESRFQTQ